MELLAQCASCSLYSPKFSPWKSHYVNSNGILRKPTQMSALNSGFIENGSISFGRMKSLVVNASNGGAEVETAVVVDGPKLRRFPVFDGSPAPFGATARDGGVNFAVYSSNAVSATLCLMSLSDLQEER